MNIFFLLVAPFLVALSYVALRILFFVLRYIMRMGQFDKMARIPGIRFLSLTGFSDNFHATFPELLINTFPKGIPPLIYGGPGLNGIPTVVVLDPAAIRTITNDVLFPKQPATYDLIGVFLGNGLVTSKGEYWQQQRNLINPWFHANKLKDMAEAMITNGDEMVEKLIAKKGVPVDVVEVMGETTQKVLVDSMFSGRIDAAWLHDVWSAANAALNPYIMWGLVLGTTLDNLSIWPWTRKVFTARALIRGKVQQLIDEANNKNKENLKEGDFIDFLVANGCSSETIFEESMTMLFAGHDTTKNTLSWLMYFLGENPTVLQKVQHEVDEELKGAAPTFSDLNKLHRCRNAFQEALRMRPAATSLDRVVGEDTTLCGTFIPKGTILAMYLHGPMMDPKYWKQPLVYNPDRFNEDPQYTHHFMPFSFGQRNCIGQKFALQEGILLLALILQRFDIVRCKEFSVNAVYEGTLVPKGLRCKFIERKK